MVEVDSETARDNGVTYVTATVTNTRTTAQRVTLESRLDGPTWTPRRRGVVAPEWDGDVWEATVQSGRQVGVGFASSAEPVDPPVALVDVARAPPAERRVGREEVLAGLADWTPPRSVLSREP